MAERCGEFAVGVRVRHTSSSGLQRLYERRQRYGCIRFAAAVRSQHGTGGAQTGQVPGFVDALRAGPIVLDGGLATELERRGADLSSALWSARLLVDDPAAILAAHRAFFAAGAQVAISASYQASLAGFAALGVDGKAMLRRSVELARAATDGVADRLGGRLVGPYGATLADGSEYRGDYRLSVAELRRFHRPRIAELASAGADVLAVETIPGLAEAEALLAEAGRDRRAGVAVDELHRHSDPSRVSRRAKRSPWPGAAPPWSRSA